MKVLILNTLLKTMNFNAGEDDDSLCQIISIFEYIEKN